MNSRHRKYVFVVIVLSSPVIWTLISHFPELVYEWVNAFNNLSDKLNFLFSSSSVAPIHSMRLAQTYTSGPVFILSKFFYNRVLLYVGEFFTFQSLFSPRIYFLAGDGTPFSPNIVEPVSVLMFPFWVYGLFTSIKDKRYRVLGSYVLSVFIVYLVGRRQFSFLLLVLIFQLYFVYKGVMMSISLKSARLYLGLSVVYGLFILGRLIFL